MAKYSNADVTWCQEEPKNQGAFFFVENALLTSGIRGGVRPASFTVTYAGRHPMASTATGHAKVHNVEQAALIAAALA